MMTLGTHSIIGCNLKIQRRNSKFSTRKTSRLDVSSSRVFILPCFYSPNIHDQVECLFLVLDQQAWNFILIGARPLFPWVKVISMGTFQGAPRQDQGNGGHDLCGLCEILGLHRVYGNSYGHFTCKRVNCLGHSLTGYFWLDHHCMSTSKLRPCHVFPLLCFCLFDVFFEFNLKITQSFWEDPPSLNLSKLRGFF